MKYFSNFNFSIDSFSRTHLLQNGKRKSSNPQRFVSKIIHYNFLEFSALTYYSEWFYLASKRCQNKRKKICESDFLTTIFLSVFLEKHYILVFFRFLSYIKNIMKWKNSSNILYSSGKIFVKRQKESPLFPVYIVYIDQINFFFK